MSNIFGTAANVMSRFGSPMGPQAQGFPVNGAIPMQPGVQSTYGMQNNAAPMTGLRGSEQALAGGANAALSAVTGSQNAANSTLNTNMQEIAGGVRQGIGMLGQAGQNVASLGNQAQNYLGGSQLSNLYGANQAAGLLGAGINQQNQAGMQAQSYLGGGINQLNSATANAMSGLGAERGRSDAFGQMAIDALQNAESTGLNRIDQNINQGISGFGQFRDPGAQATQMQAALTGALGPQAQQQAFDNFQDDPGTQWLLDRGRRERLAAASATGGLGGGNVLKALEEFGQGMANQSLSQRQDRLNQLSGMGLQAQGQIGQMRGQQAQLGSGLIGQMGQAQASTYGDTANRSVNLAGQEAEAGLRGAQIGAQLAGQQADAGLRAAMQSGDLTKAQADTIQEANRLNTSLSQTQAGTAMDQAGQEADLTRSAVNSMMQGGQLYSGAARDIASNQMQGGRNEADILTGTGELVSRGRTDAGNKIANAVQTTTTALSDLLSKEGIEMADLQGKTDAEVSDILSSLGPQQAQTLQNLAAMLSNLRTGSANTIAGLPGVQGVQQTSGALDDVAQVLAAIGTLGG